MTNLVAITVALLMSVESNGRMDAIGDHGHAVGVLQVHACMVRECNRLYPQYGFTLADRHDPALSQVMARIWLGWAASHYRIVDPRKLAMRWNCPHTGKPSRAYMRRVDTCWKRKRWAWTLYPRAP